MPPSIVYASPCSMSTKSPQNTNPSRHCTCTFTWHHSVMIHAFTLQVFFKSIDVSCRISLSLTLRVLREAWLARAHCGWRRISNRRRRSNSNHLGTQIKGSDSIRQVVVMSIEDKLTTGDLYLADYRVWQRSSDASRHSSSKTNFHH